MSKIENCPRLRGESNPMPLCPGLVRITPACAGKSKGRCPVSFRLRDHPRLRGEKCTGLTAKGHALGSPPLARGKVIYIIFQFQYLRITPACAGKSIQPLSAFAAAPDHPRLRGEKPVYSDTGSSGVGSPPLARGKVLLFCVFIQLSRITPACAGKRLYR